jgi:hypothetical protein
MACSFESMVVTASELTAEGVAVSLDVSGRLSGTCAAGTVGVRIYGADGAPIGATNTQPLGDGSFTANVKVSAACGSQVDVEVQCLRDCDWRGPLTVQCCRPNGVWYTLEIDTPDGRVDQSPQNIQDIAHHEDCNARGLYRIRVVRVGATSDPGASISQWTETNLATGETSVLSSAGQTLNYQFDPENDALREIQAHILYSAVCQSDQHPGVTLRPCGDCASRGQTLDRNGNCVDLDLPDKPRKDTEPREHEESMGCKIARWAIVFAAILAVAALEVVVCVPEASPLFGVIGVGAGIVATLVSLVWALLCPKPCRWGLLLAWQTAVGAGFVSLFFADCCLALWFIGPGLLLGGFLAMAGWKDTCHASGCAVLKEYAPIVTALAGPFLASLLDGALAGCVPFWMQAAMAGLEAGLTLAMASCISEEPVAG